MCCSVFPSLTDLPFPRSIQETEEGEVAYVEHVLPLHRLDRRSDRVEISGEQMMMAAEQVHASPPSPALSNSYAHTRSLARTGAPLSVTLTALPTKYLWILLC